MRFLNALLIFGLVLGYAKDIADETLEDELLEKEIRQEFLRRKSNREAEKKEQLKNRLARELEEQSEEHKTPTKSTKNPQSSRLEGKRKAVEEKLEAQRQREVGKMVLAEDDGAFIGLGANWVTGSMKTIAGVERTYSGMNGEIMLGVKKLISHWQGIRLRAFVSYAPNLAAKTEAKFLGETIALAYKLNLLTTGAMFDGLLNFYDSESLNFGLFGGIGGAYYKISENDGSIGGGAFVSEVGLRFLIQQHHGLEAGVKAYVFDESYDRNHSAIFVGLKYVYNF